MSVTLLLSVPSIATPRLLLRPFITSDFDALRAIESDSEVLRFRSRPVISAEQTRERLDEYVASVHDPARTRYAFAVTLRAEGVLVGDCGLTRLTDETDGAFLWYSINRDYWGNGHATEAATAVIQFGLHTLALKHIEARCQQANLASVRVLEKAGMLRDPNQPSFGADYLQFGIWRNEDDARS